MAALAYYAPCKAQVPTPPTPPPVPTDYCGTLYNELNGDLQTFNTTLTTTTLNPAPISLGPTINAVALAWANGDTGPQISNPGYIQTVQAQLLALKALGIQGVSLPILFPVLDPDFYGTGAAGVTAMQPYLNLYIAVAQAVRAAGLKLIVDDEIMFSNDIQAGWPNINTFYNSLTWLDYMTARANMAVTIAQYVQPDYLSLANEPDTEAVQTGQINLNIPADAAAMVLAEYTAVDAYLAANPSVPRPKLGAGFGTWLELTGTASLQNYIDVFMLLPLDYIDFHVIPVNTVGGDNFLENALTVASAAAASGKAVAIGQAWLGKASAAEQAGGYSVSDIDVQRARQTFSFWQPLDIYYTQVMQTLANYTQMAYLDLYDTWFTAAYQTYGGTTANGGSTNCTCVTTSTSPFYDCSDYDIMQVETSLAGAADVQSVYSAFSFGYYDLLVTTPDTIPPTQPVGLGLAPNSSVGTNAVNLAWTASSDNIGVAGYAVSRCTPPAANQPCPEVWVANTTLPGYIDTTLASGTLYNYQVEAFDFANNLSPLSSTFEIQTVITSASSPTNLVATAVSPQEISLSWQAPSNTTGLAQYLIYRGTSKSDLLQVAARGKTSTTYNDLNLAQQTTYYYGVVAMEGGIASPMSTEAWATTKPLPPPPSSVAGTPSSASKIALTWQQNVLPGGLGIARYEVFESTTPGAYPPTYGAATTKSYSATSLTPNTTYYFEIVAVDTGKPPDYSTPSDQIAVTTYALPAAPTNVAATVNSATQVTVTWSEVPPPNGLTTFTTYTVFRSQSPTGPWGSALGTVSARPPAQPATKYIDKTVVANNTYYYAIEATDTAKDVSPMSAPSNPASTPVLPAAPTSVTVTNNSETQLTVTWNEMIPTGGLPIASYTVNWGPTPTLGTSATRTTAKFIATALAPGATYYFAVEATDTGGAKSAYSATVHGTTAVQPASPVITSAVPNGAGTQITVTWTETIPSGGLPVTSYTVNWGTTPALGTSAKRTTKSFIATGLTPGVTYYFAVTATDSGGDNSPPSATVNATTP